jgi:hypothetical protein
MVNKELIVIVAAFMKSSEYYTVHMPENCELASSGC